jgi:microcin C transport system substrate-binding protein
MAFGRPGQAEIALLEPFRGKVSEEVFGDPYVPPVSDGSGQDRALLRKASSLLQEAGYAVKDGRRVTPSGEVFIVEFLIDDPVSLPHHNAFIKNLWILGIEANVRVVDPVQYRNRVDDFDFDIVVQRFGFSSTPGDTLRTFFTSRAANIRGSQNVGGISDPAIDALVECVIAADSRPALLAACKALDRVIRSGRYWVPHWYKASHWLAYWNVFGRREAQPRYALATRETWWSNA